MFCPACGSEERQPSKYCRACGADMQVVRAVLERPDSITASAVGAREEVGRAIAAKIAAAGDVRHLGKVVEDVLPELEKFLESPEERRLRRLRTGVMLSLIGIATCIFLFLAGDFVHENLPWPAGFVPFFVGVAIFINGLLFTVPGKRVGDGRNLLAKEALNTSSVVTGEIEPPQELNSAPSITENTTKHLNQLQQ
jgi:hypothetical protein